jgi:hypothetical protein
LKLTGATRWDIVERGGGGGGSEWVLLDASRLSRLENKVECSFKL